MSGLELRLLSSSTNSRSGFESLTAVLVRSRCGVVGGWREYDRVGNMVRETGTGAGAGVGTGAGVSASASAGAGAGAGVVTNTGVKTSVQAIASVH